MNFRKGLHLVPEHMHDGITNYLLHGIRPGGFFTALLTNASWTEVLQRADETNRRALPNYALFFYNYLPRSCHGSKEAVEAWLKDANGVRTQFMEHLREWGGEDDARDFATRQGSTGGW